MKTIATRWRAATGVYYLLEERPLIWRLLFAISVFFVTTMG
jgi:hypothetical protein